MFAPAESDLIKLLAGIKLKSTWGERDYLLILFLCHTGLRIGEMCRLTVDLVAFAGEPREELHIPASLTKTRRSRNIPLNPVARKSILKLLEFNKKRGFSVAPEAPLFPWSNHDYLPIREAERMVQKLREKVGVSEKVTPHTFRHFFATRLVATGTDLNTVQALLGHKSLSSTQIYTHTTQERMKAAVMRFCERGAA